MEVKAKFFFEVGFCLFWIIFDFASTDAEFKWTVEVPLNIVSEEWPSV